MDRASLTPAERQAQIVERIASTGIDEAVIERLVRAFYGKVRQDPLLGPVFEAAISDWETHLRHLMDFWSSVTLMTGRFNGRPMQTHARMDIGVGHFSRWLELFRETAAEVCTPAAAAIFVDRAERIGRSLLAGRAHLA
ncbi:group III truncated hemoglobin [Arenibaculum pallidiluteum]|uniref:group III truncated hemoglobin n=1 Tax=Arenibaculum pallidiluteum TaxID=2812559 RepID=UPI001A95BE6D|nr:group III truncated hemoglobin [Arenibaculum pallidiluteum]